LPSNASIRGVSHNRTFRIPHPSAERVRPREKRRQKEGHGQLSGLSVQEILA